MKMLAAVLHGPEDVRLEEMPVPEPQAGEVRIRVGAATTCGTDVKVWKAGGHKNMIRPPAVFGHEFSGTVDRLGPGVTGWAVGDRVVAANSAPCCTCFHCARSEFSQCEDLLYMNGAYAEFAIVPARIVQTNLLRVPPALPFAHAALAEPLACVVHGVRDCDVQAGEEVAIIGDGPIALFFTRLCAEHRAVVTVVGMNEARLSTAAQLGAARVFTGRAEDDGVQREVKRLAHSGRGFDLVVECIGQPVTWSAAISLARKHGRVNLFGGCRPGTQIAIDTARIHYDELTIMGTYHHDPPAFREAVRLLAGRVVPGEMFVSDKAPLTDLPRVLQRLAEGLAVVKVAILPGS